MFKIGDVEINGKVILAPMAGITSLAYRDFMKPFGVALSITEMVSASGLIYENDKTFDYLKSNNIDHPLAIQLFDSDPYKIVEAIKIINERGYDYDIIDINLGCPVPKVTQSGAGSALLKDTKKLFEFMRVVTENSPKPVTAKIRLGWDDNSINFLDNIKALEKAGVKAIGIHARTTKQLYEGEPRFELLKDLRDQMNIPLMISGNMFDLDYITKMMELTKADGVMIARGGTGNPRLVEQVDKYYKYGERLPNASLEENVKYMLEFTDLLIEEKDEFKAMKILRGIAPKFLNGFPNMKQVKNEIAQSISCKKDLLTILKNHELI